jgi:uncharacterized protein involved in exopolysaccharide biosynthesis
MVLWRHKGFVALAVIGLTAIAIAYALLVPPYYSSRMTLYPAGSSDEAPLGRFQGIASSLGLSLPATPTQIQIPDVLRSRRLRIRLAETKWSSSKFEQPLDLITYWGWKELDRAEGLDLAVQRLAKLIHVAEEVSGLITVSVEMEEALLARAVAKALLDFAREYIQSEYRTVASLHRALIEQRLREVEFDLRGSEDALGEFLERNRKIGDSPELQLQYGRLTREVEVAQEVFVTLRQQHEMAKIAEIRETPVINVLDSPETPVRRSRPKRGVIILGGFLGGLFIGCASILIRDRIRHANDH